jgi:hypothetical protein
MRASEMPNNANLACGNDYKEGFLNVDLSPDSKADMNFDLLATPWSRLPESHFDQIIISHFMEHVPRDRFFPVMREIWRIAKNDCSIHIACPHWRSDNFHTDPTHCLPIAERTFDFFDSTKPLKENGILYGWGEVEFFVELAYIQQNPPNGPDILHTLRARK